MEPDQPFIPVAPATADALESARRMTQARRKKTKTPWWPKAILGIVVVFIVWWYGLVYLHWSSRFVQVVTSVIPFPAVVLNGESITYHAVLEKMALLLWLAQKQNEGTRLPDNDELLSKALHALLQERAIAQLADEEDLAVTRDELQAARMNQQGSLSDKEFETQLQTSLGVDLNTFLNKILRPYLLAQKFEAHVLASSTDQSAVRTLAEQAQIRISAGQLFGTILEQAQHSAFKVDGGDQGYVSASTLPEGWSALLSMRENSTSPVIETTDTFVILAVEDVIGTGVDAQFHTKAIVFHKRGVDEVVKEYLDQSTLKEIIKRVE